MTPYQARRGFSFVTGRQGRTDIWRAWIEGATIHVATGDPSTPVVETTVCASTDDAVDAWVEDLRRASRAKFGPLSPTPPEGHHKKATKALRSLVTRGEPDLAALEEALERNAWPGAWGTLDLVPQALSLAAAERGWFDAAMVLVRRGAPVDARIDGSGRTVLSSALTRAPTVVEDLLGQGADLRDGVDAAIGEPSFGLRTALARGWALAATDAETDLRAALAACEAFEDDPRLSQAADLFATARALLRRSMPTVPEEGPEDVEVSPLSQLLAGVAPDAVQATLRSAVPPLIDAEVDSLLDADGGRETLAGMSTAERDEAFDNHFAGPIDWFLRNDDLPLSDDEWDEFYDAMLDRARQRVVGG